MNLSAQPITESLPFICIYRNHSRAWVASPAGPDTEGRGPGLPSTCGGRALRKSAAFPESPGGSQPGRSGSEQRERRLLSVSFKARLPRPWKQVPSGPNCVDNRYRLPCPGPPGSRAHGGHGCVSRKFSLHGDGRADVFTLQACNCPWVAKAAEVTPGPGLICSAGPFGT